MSYLIAVRETLEGPFNLLVFFILPLFMMGFLPFIGIRVWKGKYHGTKKRFIIFGLIFGTAALSFYLFLWLSFLIYGFQIPGG